jgi:hypothetical protein
VKVCLKPHVVTTTLAHLRHGAATTAHGQLLNAQGAPVGGQQLDIYTTPTSGGQRTLVATVTTAANGTWTARVPAGPSRVVDAFYPGSASMLPATGTARVSVPAKVNLAVSPTRLPWGAITRLRGKLVGGFVPPKGVAMRILIKIPGLAKPYVSASFRTTAKGTFSLRFIAPTVSHAPETLQISVGMVGDEDGYPFTASRSGWVKVRFGVATPRSERR